LRPELGSCPLRLLEGPAAVAGRAFDLLLQRVGEGTRTPGPQDHNLVL
jgi:hypothetical protein